MRPRRAIGGVRESLSEGEAIWLATRVTERERSLLDNLLCRTRRPRRSRNAAATSLARDARPWPSGHRAVCRRVAIK